MSRRGALALAALAAILVVTAAWWALALWPVGAGAPAWIERTRAVCFGVGATGLPNAGGWIVLIGEPIGMLGFLVVVWRDAVAESLGALARSRPGRAVLGAVSAALLVGIATAATRVAAAAGTARVDVQTAAIWSEPERLDQPAPPLSLVDQRGDTVDLDRFSGRPVVVAFAYAHCETVCPLLVHDAVVALERARTHDPVLLVVTLDPWRDTPERLAHIATSWRLPATAHMLGGSVDLVERTLDAWGISRARDPGTGQLVHPVTIYLVDRAGRLAYVARGDAARVAGLLARL